MNKVFLIFSLLVLVFLSSCGSDSEGQVDGFQYEIVNDGQEITITSYNYTGSKDIVIPDTIEGKPVTTIGSEAFLPESEGNELETIIIPDGVINIENYAFMYNELSSIIIPDSVLTIGNYAFAYNELTSVTIGNSVTTIGEFSFAYNELISVTISDSVITIKERAFAFNDLTNIILSNNLETIEDYAFAYNLIEEVTFPSSVTIIEDNAFVGNPLYNLVFLGDETIFSPLIDILVNPQKDAILADALAVENAAMLYCAQTTCAINQELAWEDIYMYIAGLDVDYYDLDIIPSPIVAVRNNDGKFEIYLEASGVGRWEFTAGLVPRDSSRDDVVVDID